MELEDSEAEAEAVSALARDAVLVVEVLCQASAAAAKAGELAAGPAKALGTHVVLGGRLDRTEGNGTAAMDHAEAGVEGLVVRDVGMQAKQAGLLVEAVA